MKSINKKYIGATAAIVDTTGHHFKLGDRVVLRGIDRGGYMYWCEQEGISAGFQQVIRPYQLKLIGSSMFKVGDKVRVNYRTWSCFSGKELPQEAVVEDVSAYCDRVSVRAYDTYQNVKAESLTLLPEPSKAERHSQLTLVKAEFKDEDGNSVTLKRSKCRHYYIKEAGKNQMRASFDDIVKYLGNLA